MKHFIKFNHLFLSVYDIHAISYRQFSDTNRKTWVLNIFMASGKEFLFAYDDKEEWDKDCLEIMKKLESYVDIFVNK